MIKKIIVSKKAMMKTVEVFLATMITFAFVLVILPPRYDYKEDLSNSLLMDIEKDVLFRQCVITENSTCLSGIIRNSLYGYYNFSYIIFDDPLDEPIVSALPDRKINTYTVIVSGNLTFYNPKIFKLYYWLNKDE
jgi:hypothetical protein